ncbi:MAG: hypothetical protein FVQ79_01455 [Planctomycetes bacterium]|nr:hypothetical protein [Planctomycetota bacterium]
MKAKLTLMLVAGSRCSFFFPLIASYKVYTINATCQVYTIDFAKDFRHKSITPHQIAKKYSVDYPANDKK